MIDWGILSIVIIFGWIFIFFIIWVFCGDTDPVIIIDNSTIISWNPTMAPEEPYFKEEKPMSECKCNSELKVGDRVIGWGKYKGTIVEIINDNMRNNYLVAFNEPRFHPDSSLNKRLHWWLPQENIKKLNECDCTTKPRLKFKVGDRVCRTLEPFIGMSATIMEIDGSTIPYRLAFDDPTYDWWSTEENIRLIEMNECECETKSLDVGKYLKEQLNRVAYGSGKKDGYKVGFMEALEKVEEVLNKNYKEIISSGCFGAVDLHNFQSNMLSLFRLKKELDNE